MLDLFAEMCLGRNTEVQEYLSAEYEQKVLYAIAENENNPSEVRLRVIRLIRNLYMDVGKFPKIEIPRENVIWDQITALS